MKLNNKGFTVVELLATFALTMVIMVFLFEIVLELKNVYVTSNIETLVKNENALIASELNRQVYRKYVPITNFENPTSFILYNAKNNDEKVVKINSTNEINYVQIGIKHFEMPKGAVIDNINIDKKCATSDTKSRENCFLKVSYIVKSSDLKNDIPFNLVLTYKG